MELDEIWGYAWNIWKDNLGLLVGVTVVLNTLQQLSGNNALVFYLGEVFAAGGMRNPDMAEGKSAIGTSTSTTQGVRLAWKTSQPVTAMANAKVSRSIRGLVVGSSRLSWVRAKPNRSRKSSNEVLTTKKPIAP